MAAYHVFAAREFDYASSDFAVASSYSGNKFVDGDVVGLKPVRIDVDLILSDESAERRDLGDARNGLKVISEIVVLERAQLGQIVLAGSIDERVLEHPPDSGCVGTELGLNFFRQRGE